MIGIQTKITRNRFRELSKQGKRAAYERNVDLAETAEDIMHQLVPKKSHDLDSTIRTVKDPKNGTAGVAVGGVAKSGRIVDYHLLVNYGTRYMDAQPYIEPAIASTMKTARNRRIRMYRG